MKKLCLFLLMSMMLLMIASCKSEPVWSRIEEHDLENTSDEPEIIGQSLFENQIPPEQEDNYFHDYYSFDNYNDSENLARKNDDNSSNKNETVEVSNKSQNENKNDTNIDSEKITGYLHDILAAITSSENKNTISAIDKGEYIPPEQLPLIDDPIVRDTESLEYSNETEPDYRTSSTIQRQSYIQEAWPRPGTDAWLAAQSGTRSQEGTEQENDHNEIDAQDIETDSEDNVPPAESSSADEENILAGDINILAEQVDDELDNLQISYADSTQAETSADYAQTAEALDTVAEEESLPAQITTPEDAVVPEQLAEFPSQQSAAETQTASEQTPLLSEQTQVNPTRQNDSDLLPVQSQQVANVQTQQVQPATQPQQAVAQQQPQQVLQGQQPAIQQQAQSTQPQQQTAPAQPTSPVQSVPSQSSTASVQRGQTQTQQTTPVTTPQTPVQQTSPVRQNQQTASVPQNQQTQTPVTTPQTPAQQTSPARQNQQTQTAQQRQPTAATQQNESSTTRATQPTSPTTDQMSYQHIPETEIAQAETAEEISRTTSPSRSVTLDLGAYLDVNYPGSGWIYLGESEGSNCLQFFGRKLGETDTAFTLRAKTPGTALLHFYKNDLLTGKYIDDWLEVTVTDKQVANSSIHVTAPSYAAVIPPRPTRSQTNETQTYVAREQQTPAPEQPQRQNAAQPAANTASQEKPSESVGGRTVIQTTTNTSQSENTQRQNQPEIPQPQNTPTEAQTEPQAIASIPSDTNALLDRAKQLYNSGNHADALNILHQFFDTAKDKIDEGLFLQGQILESNSSVRDIRAAIDSYQILINNWPDSALWQDAQRRYIYLRRFYINIH